MNSSAESIAIAWIEKWRKPPEAHEPTENDLDDSLPGIDPRLALEAIVEVLGRIPADTTSRHFQVLAAGPLEDLIAFHGIELLSEIETHARRSPQFRLLLNGVWFDHASTPVREHLKKYLGARW
ncbi:MAG: hypothetical protein KF823_02655 [Xanthomonadales bacterium]|nr:hypothetical protein [Xanthomonadales bacterium]